MPRDVGLFLCCLSPLNSFRLFGIIRAPRWETEAERQRMEAAREAGQGPEAI